MSIRIINGYTGQNHVYGYDFADLFRGIFGKTNCVLGSNIDNTGNLNCVINGNSASISFENGIGSLMFSGVQAVINAAEVVDFAARTENRTDTIAAVYRKDNKGIESIEIEVKTSTEPTELTPQIIDSNTTLAYFPLFKVTGTTTSALTITKLYQKRALLGTVENDNKVVSKQQTPTGANYSHQIDITTCNSKSQYAIQVTDVQNSNNVWRYYDLSSDRMLELGAENASVKILGTLQAQRTTQFNAVVTFNNPFYGDTARMSNYIRFQNGTDRNCTVYTGQDNSTTALGAWDSKNNHSVWHYTTAEKLFLGCGSVPVKLNGVATDKNDNNLTQNCMSAYNNNQATLSKDATDQKITLTSLNSVGSDLSISNGGIKIGANIKNVLVSGIVKMDPAAAGAKVIKIYKNTSVAAQAREYLSSTADNSVIIPPRVVSVSPGDIIYLYVYGAKNDKVPSGSTASYITVQAIG